MATTGPYVIWTADSNGAVLDGPIAGQPEVNQFPVPSNPAALEIYFGLDSGALQPPSKVQGELQSEIAQVLSVVQKLYIGPDSSPAPKFRRYYVRLFRLAQLGLEGPNASPEVATSALASVKRDLISEESGRVKNGHLMTLGKAAATFSIPLLVIYVGLALFRDTQFDDWLNALGIVRSTAANFIVLWLGCFLGVWLSYGIRTASLTLDDLIITDSDRLLPHMRLLFAGALTMVLGMLFVAGIVEIKIGSYGVTEIAKNPMLAFLVGVICGISEAALPQVASRRASAFIADLK